MLRIGLTGGIGAGKSTVSRAFAECGGVIVDGDVISREVVQPGTEGLAALVRTDPNARKQKGISYLLIDMKQPVDIRHIATLVDQSDKALFFHNVIGYDMPVVSGIIRTQKRAAMGMDLRRCFSRSDRPPARAREGRQGGVPSKEGGTGAREAAARPQTATPA